MRAHDLLTVVGELAPSPTFRFRYQGQIDSSDHHSEALSIN